MRLEDIESQIKILFELWAEKKEAQDKSIDKVRYSGPVFGSEEYSSMLDAIFAGWWSGGKFTVDAESKLAVTSERNHGLLTNSGSSANLLMMSAVKELYFKDGDKILTLSCGFPTTVNPIITNKLVPLFVDIDLETLSLDPGLLEEVLKKDDKVKGIFIAHTLGFKGDIDSILDISRKYGVQVFFDCCDAYGSTHKSQPLASFGKASTLSFYVAHHLSCGEGGGVVTNDPELHSTMRGFRSWGRYCASPNCCIRAKDPAMFCPQTKLTTDSKLPQDYMVNYQFEWMGYNLKPLEIQSALLLPQLDRLDEFTTIRRHNYGRLFSFMDSTDVGFRLWDLDEETSPFAFPLLIPRDAPFKRKHLVDFLTRNKIECRMLFGGNLLKHPAYDKNRGLWDSYGSHDNADEILEQFLMLGVSQVNHDEHIDRVIYCLEEFLNRW